MSKIKGTTDMANMKDFLTAYYNRLIFREMSHEQFIQFCGYIKDKKATDNQKIWAEELLKKDATGNFVINPDTGLYERKQLPDPLEPSDEFYLGADDKEWKKLFKAFQTAFQSMDGDRKSFKYNDKATDFLNKYFGSHTVGAATIQHLFQYTAATPEAKQKIAPTTSGVSLHSFLKKYQHRLELQLKNWGLLNDDFTYSDLLSGIESEKYNKNPKFRKQMTDVAQAIDSYIAGDTTLQARLGITSSTEIPDLSDTSNWFNDDNISTFRLEQFKHEYPTLLNTLRKESKIRSVFGEHDGGKICGPLNKALGNLKYDDPQSEDYVQPKREDTLTIPEIISEWCGDTYSDCIEKYAKLKGDRLFFSNEAKAICKHLQKNHNPTEGLDAVLKKVGDAKSKLNAAREKKAADHLDWFEKTLTHLQNDPKLSKVWAGALRNGTHMQALIKEMIVRAIKEGKKEECKTAMEIISVLHYDYTTSKVMDALKKSDLSLFSAKELSWNKNKGMQFITNALDTSIKTAFLGIGYAVTMVGNAINLSGRKITQYSDNNKHFQSEHKQYLEDQQASKQNLIDLLAKERGQQTATQRTVNRILGTRGFTQAKTGIENEITRLNNSINDFCQADIQALQQAIIDTADNVNNGTGWTPIANQSDYNKLIAFLDSVQTDTLATPPTLTGTGTSLQSHITNIVNNHASLVNDKKTLQTQRQELDDLINGTDLLNQLNAQIAEHENEVNTWDANHFDEMEELVKHWNLLETGRNTKTGPMYNWFRRLSKKKAQKDLDNNKAAIIAQYNATHSIAA